MYCMWVVEVSTVSFSAGLLRRETTGIIDKRDKHGLVGTEG